MFNWMKWLFCELNFAAKMRARDERIYYSVLQAMDVGRAMHGYEILQAVRKVGPNLAVATLYRYLRRLRNDGLIERTDDRNPEDSRLRYFILTNDGKNSLEMVYRGEL